eukprot:3680110-Prymnesium_polylepis.1
MGAVVDVAQKAFHPKFPCCCRPLVVRHIGRAEHARVLRAPVEVVPERIQHPRVGAQQLDARHESLGIRFADLLQPLDCFSLAFAAFFSAAALASAACSAVCPP